MLDAAGQKAGGFLRLLLAPDILVMDDDMGIPFHFSEEFRYRQAAFGVDVLFIAVRFPYGVDVGFEAGLSVVGHKNSLGNGNLWSRQAYAIGFVEGFLHIVDQKFQFFIEFGDRFCRHGKDRVSGGNNFTQNRIPSF